MVSEGIGEIWIFLTNALLVIANAEFNGNTSFNRIDGMQGCVNASIAIIRLLLLVSENNINLPYCTRDDFNLGIKVDESDINYLAFVNGNTINVPLKGTLLERLEQIGQPIPYFIPITKEEYENLSNDFK